MISSDEIGLLMSFLMSSAFLLSRSSDEISLLIIFSNEHSDDASFLMISSDEVGLLMTSSNEIKAEARGDAESEPALASYLYATVLSHPSLACSLSFHVANKLFSSILLSTLLYDLFLCSFSSHPPVRTSAVAELLAVRHHDPACASFSTTNASSPSRPTVLPTSSGSSSAGPSPSPSSSASPTVDIHPAARLGRGLLLDHATGVVIGETAVVGNNVSILHHVTLGATGKAVGDRHPKIGDGVLIGAGVTILGNVRIGEGAKIDARSVVHIDVPPRTTAVGIPARLIGSKEKPARHEDIPGESMDHTSFISE
ncbi:Serine acetyltransferase 5 [Cocos nucifera]|nr:Serine acetyltransferase 5 [Cocos nucifera]